MISYSVDAILRKYHEMCEASPDMLHGGATLQAAALAYLADVIWRASQQRRRKHRKWMPRKRPDLYDEQPIYGDEK